MEHGENSDRLLPGLNQEGETAEKQIETVSLELPNQDILRILEKDRIVSVDLSLTPEEKESIQKFKVEKNIADFNYWGSVSDENLPQVLKHYLNEIGENSEATVEIITRLMARIAEGVARHFNTKFVWIESRSFLPNNTFETSRWHSDGKYFAPYTTYKLVAAIKGPQTRFGDTSEPEKFVELSIAENKEKHGSAEDIRIRKEIDAIVSEVHLPAKENATVYLASGDDAFIHSEPLINEERLFISVIPGSEEEINEWRIRMEKKRQRKSQDNKPQ